MRLQRVRHDWATFTFLLNALWSSPLWFKNIFIRPGGNLVSSVPVDLPILDISCIILKSFFFVLSKLLFYKKNGLLLLHNNLLQTKQVLPSNGEIRRQMGGPDSPCSHTYMAFPPPWTSPIRWYMCYNWQTYIETLSPRVHSLHEGSLLVLCVLWLWTNV